jgi:hypothetical protein
MVTGTWKFRAILGPGLQNKFSDLQRNRSPQNLLEKQMHCQSSRTKDYPALFFWRTDSFYSWSWWCWIWHSYHKGNSHLDCWLQITLMPPLVLHHRIPSLTSFKIFKCDEHIATHLIVIVNMLYSQRIQ